MSEDNKHNLLYFEGASMKELYKSMENWQNINQKRLLSTSIHYDNGQYCCIALTNPTEVVITNGYHGYGASGAHVFEDGRLAVQI